MRGALAELLDERRLANGSAGSGERRTFTISQTAALLQMRKDAPKDSWAWTLFLLRAANLLSTSAAAGARSHNGEEQVLEIELVHPGFELVDFDLADPLVGALSPDVGLAFGDEGHERDRMLQRWRVLVGRALNMALAQSPVALELLTAAGGRRWERRAEVADGGDPYAMRVLPASERRSGFHVRVINEARGFGDRVRSFFGADSPTETLAHLWDERLMAPAGGGDAPDITSPRSIAPIVSNKMSQLGPVARVREAGGKLESTWLTREGVKLLRLDPVLAKVGFAPSSGAFIDCPGLRLTADEREVVQDTAFDELVTWLFDMQAHTHEVEGGKSELHWPERIESLSAASGRPVSLADLETWIDSGRELLYVAPHRVGQVPATMRARVLLIWPSALRLLLDSYPDARWVPLRALGDRPSLNPIDLSALGQGSFEAISLARGTELAWEDAPGAPDEAGALSAERLSFDVDAYVHRFAGATLGSILVLSYGRRVAHTRDHTRTLPGMTLVVKLRELSSGRWVSADELRGRPKVVDQIFDRCARLVAEQGDALLAAVLEFGGSWETPFAQYQLGQLNGWTLGLRYREHEGELELAWNAHPALGLQVAIDPTGKVLTLEEVLERVRAVGFVPEKRDRANYGRLESRDPMRAGLRFRRGARELVYRVLGEEVVLALPFLVDAQPRVAEASEQRELLGATSLLRDDRARAAQDSRARLRILGRLLVARAEGADTHELEGARLFRRYDPRALSPTRRQSLRMLLRERERPGLAFPGAVSRELGGTVLEVPPPLAHLLYHHEGFRPALRGSIAVEASSASRSRTGGSVPRRRRGAPVMPLLRRRVDHEWAVGSLSVAADGVSGGIALWSKGLEVGTLRLPEPAGRVRGRLWLTKQGRLARSSELQTVVAGLAHELLLDAPRQRDLMVVGDPRREALGHLMEYLAARELQFEGHPPLPAFETGLDASLKRMPTSQRFRGDLLADLIRNAIGQKAPISGAMLSWTLAELQDGRSKIELGNRNRWVKAAADSPEAAFEAAALVLDAIFRDPAWLADLNTREREELLRHLDWGLRSRWRLCARLLDLS